MILVTWAGAMITAHTLVLMCYVRVCYRVWTQPRTDKGYLGVAYRAFMGAVTYAGVGGALGLPLICSVSLLSMSPELASNLSSPLGLVERVAHATFGLPF